MLRCKIRENNFEIAKVSGNGTLQCDLVALVDHVAQSALLVVDHVLRVRTAVVDFAVVNGAMAGVGFGGSRVRRGMMHVRQLVNQRNLYVAKEVDNQQP